MFVNYRTQGFIFKKENRAEADQLFSIYTKDFGRLEVLGKAIRKSSSKLRAGIELFYLSEIEFIQGKNYKTLTDALAWKKFQSLREDLKKLKIAYQISDILDNLLKVEEREESLWQLILEVFNKLNQPEILDRKLEIIFYSFFWNFVSILGYKPELYHCLFCQKKLKPGKLYLNSQEGGIVCSDCQKKEKNVKEIDIETTKLLRIILEKDWSILSRLKMEKEQLKQLGILSKNYYDSLLEINKFAMINL